jgi:hypothetical protein
MCKNDLHYCINTIFGSVQKWPSLMTLLHKHNFWKCAKMTFIIVQTQFLEVCKNYLHYCINTIFGSVHKLPSLLYKHNFWKCTKASFIKWAKCCLIPLIYTGTCTLYFCILFLINKLWYQINKILQNLWCMYWINCVWSATMYM